MDKQDANQIIKEVVVWMYVNDRAFKSAVEWRKAFVEHLNKVVESLTEPSID